MALEQPVALADGDARPEVTAGRLANASPAALGRSRQSPAGRCRIGRTAALSAARLPLRQRRVGKDNDAQTRLGNDTPPPPKAQEVIIWFLTPFSVPMIPIPASSCRGISQCLAVVSGTWATSQVRNTQIFTMTT